MPLFQSGEFSFAYCRCSLVSILGKPAHLKTFKKACTTSRVTLYEYCYHFLICRTQLSVVISGIIKHDFPERFPAVVEQIIRHLQSENTATWLGALICLHQLIKHYEWVQNISDLRYEYCSCTFSYPPPYNIQNILFDIIVLSRSYSHSSERH